MRRDTIGVLVTGLIALGGASFALAHPAGDWRVASHRARHDVSDVVPTDLKAFDRYPSGPRAFVEWSCFGPEGGDMTGEVLRRCVRRLPAEFRAEAQRRESMQALGLGIAVLGLLGFALLLWSRRRSLARERALQME